MDMKRFFLYAIVIAALALAGCGGNGGGGMMAGNGGTPPPATCDPGQTGTPPNCVTPPPPTCLEDPMDTDCTGPTQAQIDAEKAATAAAATKLTEIRIENGQADAGLGGSDIATEHTFAITRDSDGTEIEFTIAGAGDNDPKFEKAMDLTDGNGNGFPGTMHVRTMKAGDDGNVESEVVIVRTDIDPPMPTAFGDVHDLDANPETENGMDYQSVEIDADNLAMVMTDGIVATGAGTVTLLAAVADDPQTMDDETVAAFETMAAFDGAMGTLKCAGSTDCTATLDGDGKITALSTGWEFTPRMGATVYVDDTSYLAYGFWLNRTSKDGVVTKYNEVETFVMVVGMDATEPGTGDTQMGTVVGSATYEGGSAGVYVKNVTDNAGAITSATSGHFQADVTLNAYFGGGNVPANKQFTIDGTVTNFDLAGGEENDWAVKLGLADFTDRQGMGPGKEEPGNSRLNSFIGVATGDSTAADGSWDGTFYGAAGSAIDHDNDGTTDAIAQQPSAVVGEFNAFFTDGGVAGGYGANKQ